MPMGSLDLPDLNVWLALADPDHQHHGRAAGYWADESSPEIAFCRVTMLGLLRLLTHPTVMGGNPFSVAEAWSAYEAFAALPEICHIEESLAADAEFSRWTNSPGFPADRWTDAWIAAIAHSANARVVSFDADFASFDGLRFLHLTV